MASLIRFPGGSRNRGDKGRSGPFYARVYIPRLGQRPKAKLIPLKTENAREAAIRLQEVEKVEALVKRGVEYTFPWMNGSPTAVKRITLQEAVREYMKAREDEGLRRKTLEAYSLALSHFLGVAGKDRPIETIATKDIQAFIRAYQESHSVTTININLRSIKTFLLWAYESKLVAEPPPKVRELQNGRGLPRYLSNEEFNRLQAKAKTIPFLTDVFWFYRETGCRLREPFNAVLKGSFLLVPSESSKGHEDRQIPLNHDLIRIYRQLMEAGHDAKYYTDQFRMIAKEIKLEGHKFHDLRHTFGVRTWLQTGDIYLVAQLMGHKSILTTQIYARFFISRLQEDFPDLAGYATDRTKGRAEILQRGNGALVEKEVL